MLRVWKWYQKCLAKHPIKTQVISSAFIWGFGDVAAQAVSHSTATANANAHHLLTHDGYLLVPVNWRRVAAASLYGLAFIGPIGHFWYEGLDGFIKFRLKLRANTFRFVAAKVAADVIIFGSLDLLIFFVYMGFTSGKTAAQVKEEVWRDFLPTLVLEGGVWPIVQVANFRYVPVRYQLLYVNFFCLLDSCFLSWVEQHKTRLGSSGRIPSVGLRLSFMGRATGRCELEAMARLVFACRGTLSSLPLPQFR